MQQKETGLQQSVDMVSENAKNIIGALHETIWVLNREIITVTEFIDRFKEYARKILKNYPGIEVSYAEEIEHDVQLLPEEALHVFRIMQEAFQNALKHAGPSKIIITVKTADRLFISVLDNGKGFNTAAYNAGYGLSNIKERAREVGYEVELVSGTAGTELRLKGTRKINGQNRSFAV
jgi:signal transduction histidine kinase